jgi:hypothetical protein
MEWDGYVTNKVVGNRGWKIKTPEKVKEQEKMKLPSLGPGPEDLLFCPIGSLPSMSLASDAFRKKTQCQPPNRK